MRLTSEWTDTLEQAFGETGRKGREGELFLLEVFKSWGYYCGEFESNIQAQKEGKDVWFQKPSWSNRYTADVKNNLKDDGTFFVHKDWLFKNKCDRIFHVNPKTKKVVWYGLAEMQQYFNKHSQNDKMTFTIYDKPGFVSTSTARI